MADPVQLAAGQVWVPVADDEQDRWILGVGVAQPNPHVRFLTGEDTDEFSSDSNDFLAWIARTGATLKEGK